MSHDNFAGLLDRPGKYLSMLYSCMYNCVCVSVVLHISARQRLFHSSVVPSLAEGRTMKTVAFLPSPIVFTMLQSKYLARGRNSYNVAIARITHDCCNQCSDRGDIRLTSNAIRYRHLCIVHTTKLVLQICICYKHSRSNQEYHAIGDWPPTPTFPH